MEKKDLFYMCFQNLMRRKSRTFLTALGVLIGCCSIVIMVSLGMGMKESQEKMLSQMGDLTIITVTSPQRGQQTGKQAVKLNNDFVKLVKKINGVEAVTPKISLEGYSCRLYAGDTERYVAEGTTIVALDTSALEKMGYQTIYGEIPNKKNEVLAGQYFSYNFSDTMRPDGFNYVDRWSGDFDEQGNPINLPDPFFDPLKEKLRLELEKDNKKFSISLTVSGSVKEDYSKGYETTEGIILSLSDFEELLLQAEGSTQKKGVYDSVLVKVSDISKVGDVETEIKKFGYNTESMESIRKPMEEEAHQKQMILGGLGAISLLVAALGITNTMIMSISERTREIGIMKSLGCYVYDIKTLFLTEAGIIGLIGGIVGSIISFLISVIINVISMKSLSFVSLKAAIFGSEEFSRASVTPIWLLVFAVFFSVLIGLGAGYYPANKAVQIPALEAIKNE